LPFEDQAGQYIADYESWIKARNQQRNWETVMQVISLRAQPTLVDHPKQQDLAWQFEFEVEVAGVYSGNGDVNDYSTLMHECDNVPMIVGLTENASLEPRLISQGLHQNIWFETVNNS
jgi:hypothetical protein